MTLIWYPFKESFDFLLTFFPHALADITTQTTRKRHENDTKTTRQRLEARSREKAGNVLLGTRASRPRDVRVRRRLACCKGESENITETYNPYKLYHVFGNELKSPFKGDLEGRIIIC